MQTGDLMHPDDRSDPDGPKGADGSSALVDGLESLAAPFFQARIAADRHYRQGIELEARGQWARALQSFRSACDLHPQRVLYLVARGRVCQANGLDNEAAACYALARRVDPVDPVTLFNEADLLVRRGDIDGAISNLRDLLALNGDTLGSHAAAAWRLLGDLELACRNVDAAIDSYRRGALALPADPYLRTVAAAEDRLRDITASDETAARVDASGVVLPAKAATYAFAGAMLFGLPDDNGIEIPTYPGLGFVSVEEVAQAVARPLALFRRRVHPFAAVYPTEPDAAPVAQAFAVALGIPIDADPTGARLSVGIVGYDPIAMRRDHENPNDWAFCIGLRFPSWRYADALDGTLVAAEVEVPWATADARAQRPEGDVGAALTSALLRVDGADDQISMQLNWHRSRPHLRAGNPSATYMM
jgi:tetratricopeptide (TPR) repeat protein